MYRIYRQYIGKFVLTRINTRVNIFMKYTFEEFIPGAENSHTAKVGVKK